MCGIFGVSRYTENFGRIAPLLAWELASRGIDSWGMSNGDEVIRRSGGMRSTWMFPPNGWKDGPVGWHNRGASFRDNASREDCAHPFTFATPAGGRVIGFHNGVIRNHDELNKKYGRDFPVDSMHLWAHKAQGLSWKELRGWGNLVWYEIGPDGKRELFLCHINDNDLHAFSMEDGSIIWCSVPGPVRLAVKMMGGPQIKADYHLDPFRKYRISRGEDGRDILWKTEESLRFGEDPPVRMVPLPEGWRGVEPGVWRSSRPRSVTCKNCFQSLAESYKDGILCEGCLGRAVERWLRKDAKEVNGSKVSQGFPQRYDARSVWPLLGGNGPWDGD